MDCWDTSTLIPTFYILSAQHCMYPLHPKHPVTAVVADAVNYNNKIIKPGTMTNCRTQNIIYLIMCPCELGKVGESGREFTM